MRTVVTLCAVVVLAGIGYGQSPSQSSEPVWMNPATWAEVKPVETDNIVFRNVPLIQNPSAASDPGTPAGIRQPIPENVPAGTMNLHLDVYQVASNTPAPVVIQFHGGGWIRGDRPSSYRTFSAFMAAGMSVVTVQYRNAKDAPAPAAIEDIRCAMSWVKKNAAKYNFDLNRVITYGGSAGGHLALMAAYAPASYNPPGCTDQPKVAAVLEFYGPTNLTEGLTQRGSSDFTHQWLGTQLPLPPDSGSAGQTVPTAATVASNNAGGNPDGMPIPPRRAIRRWPDADAKTLELAKQMSPLTYVRPGLPPTFIVNGDSDRTVDPTQSAELKRALDTAGVPNGQDLVVGGGHGNFSREEDQKAMLLCLEFLRKQGILQ